MSLGNTTENDLAKLMFQAVALTWNSATDIDIHLHTADPGEAGIETTSEATYTGYATVTVVRSAVGWTVANNVASNAALVQFPACTAGSNTITHISVSPSGTTQIIGSGALSSSLNVSAGIQPQFAIGALTVTLD